MDELVHFFDGDVHAVVGGDVAFEFEKVAADVVDVNEGEFFVDVVLSDVDVEVVEAVLVMVSEMMVPEIGECLRMILVKVMCFLSGI